VYWFLDENDNVLYVGKAKNIKNRIASYKQWQTTAGKTRKLVFAAKQLKHQALESELEALLVEAELIRTHQPPFNILLKDDKTPLYVHITDEEFPRVLTIRKKEVEKGIIRGTILGPFPSAFQVREVLDIARHIFPWCNGGKKPCFYYHLELCPGACIGAISAAEYQQNIAQLVLFLKGKKKNVVREIEVEMKRAAAAENFEYAAKLRDRIQLIKVVTEKGYQLKPDLHLPKLKQSLRAEGLIYLRRIVSTHFALPKNYPLKKIECYDVSNIQGTNAAVALISFSDGLPNTADYRLFNIRTLKTPNDFAMLQEALTRRQNHPEWGMPDLIVIDGGKGQLRAVLKIWGWSTPVISLAKNPDRILFPIFADGIAGTPSSENATRNLTGLKYHELQLEEGHPALVILQHLRDEAHRFSKRQHTRLRNTSMLE
jgi:excinuclease ABC subunit C